MAFTFGGTQSQPNLGFGSTPAKTGFGNTGFSFGTPATTTASGGFGAFGSTFATPATSSGGFGSFSLPTSTPAPNFGGFGASTSTAAPTFGSFGTAPTSSAGAAPSFGGFGLSTTSAPSFGGFGATSSAPTNTFGGFGAASSTAGAAPAFGGFGVVPTTQSGFGGFGAPVTSTAGAATGFGGFGSFGATPATTANLFSGFGAGTTTTAGGFGGFGGFGTNTTSSGGFGGFGTAFGAKPATSTGFGGFGSALAVTQLQQPPTVDQNQALYNSVFNCSIFNDERDAILAKWNLLQASWGCGRGFYSQNQPPVEYTQHNPYCRFKAIGYSVIPGHDNKEGLVAIVVGKKESDVKVQKDQLLTSLTAVMGNKPNLIVSIHSIRAISEPKTQVLVFVQEKGMTGTVRKIPATDLANFLLQPVQKQQLVTLGIENVFAHVKPDSDQLKEYLGKPPTGVDLRIWKQAQLDNPNPSKYIPVPLIGFEQLKWRSKCQEKETALHRGFLEQVSKDIVELKRRHAASVAQISEQKRKLLELQHRVLRILVRQEVTRKAGMALQPEEEVLKGQLENMQTQISVPTQFKGRLNELLAQIRIMNQNGQVSTTERYTMDPGVQEDIKQFLRMEHEGIKHLVHIINTDLSHLKVIRDGMQELLQRQI